MNKWSKCKRCPFNNVINKQDCDYYILEGCPIANKIIKQIKNEY